MITEVITASGHANILANHNSTFEITKDEHLTRRGDCVIAVAADKGANDLGEEFKRVLSKAGAKLTIVIQVGELRELVEAWGSPKLTFHHPADMVFRKSSFVCDRTLAINANKAAKDFSRSLVEKLRHQPKVEITLAVETTI